MKNRYLKVAIFVSGKKYKEIAEAMGINRKTFCNKINHASVNGYVARFNPAEKYWLAKEFGIDENDIE